MTSHKLGRDGWMVPVPSRKNAEGTRLPPIRAMRVPETSAGYLARFGFFVTCHSMRRGNFTRVPFTASKKGSRPLISMDASPRDRGRDAPSPDHKHGVGRRSSAERTVEILEVVAYEGE